MGFCRTDLDNPNLSPEDRRDFEELLRRYTECDKWAVRAQQPIGVLLTSHPNNRLFLTASVKSHKKLGYWLVLAYDNWFDPEREDITYDTMMPAMDVMRDIDTFVMPHHQTWGGVLYPYFWLLKFGLATMTGFEYVYCTNGDCILEKPENFPKIIEMLGDADIMGCGWENAGGGMPIFNTTAFLAKTDAVQKIMKHVEDHFIPFEVYEKYTQDFGNAEARFARAILDLNLKYVKEIEPGFNTQFHKKGFGTWYDILGFRHIHAEYGYSYRYKGIPPELKYYDKRYTPDYAVIAKYWETRDTKVLEDGWWVKE